MMNVPQVQISSPKILTGFLSLFFNFLFLVPVENLQAAQNEPEWIWSNADSPRDPAVWFLKSFDVPQGVAHAELRGVADFCEIELSLNGKAVANVESYSPKFHIDLTNHLNTGVNQLAIAAKGSSGPSAIALQIVLTLRDGQTRTVSTDATWRCSTKVNTNWMSGKGSNWVAAVSLGRLATEPWGTHPDSVTVKAQDDYTQWKLATGSGSGPDAKSFFTQPGFQVEILRMALPTEGSWVSLAFDPQGRAIIAREDRGLLRVSLAEKTPEVTKVETINDSLKECRGLLFAHGSLYANANESQGLYRLRDTNGDDSFDEVKLLRAMPGGRGHGRNDLSHGPDGKIYAIHGDSVIIPEEFTQRFSPFQKYRHPGQHGFVMRTDSEGKTWEVLTSGMRNPFGIAFNDDGEMFTYDADAEYDMGSSWYRPTRILHLEPGGDFGWRGVTRSWPAYDPDSPDATPPALEIGKGSPTALKFGTGSHFPPKYQQALYALDWAYGRILAIHMTPRGASYAMRAETFLKGQPLNVTDLEIGPDGAMYLVTGGRKTQSGLYRISFAGGIKKGKQSTVQQQARIKHAETARKLRQQLEDFQLQPTKSSLDLSWKHLGNPDPFVRHAARIALEHHPVNEWRLRAHEEQDTLVGLTALLALTRSNLAPEFPHILNSLKKFDWQNFSVTEQLLVIRIHELIANHTESTETLRQNSYAQLHPYYPAAHFRVNQQLGLLLELRGGRTFIETTVKLLEASQTQREQFHYLYLLRNVKTGWSEEARERYFRALARMKNFLGGEGMPNFIQRIQTEATASLPEQGREKFVQLLQRDVQSIEIPEEARDREVVQQWKSNDLVDLFSGNQRPNFARGQTMFAAANCSACHRLNERGRAIGPDLSAVGRRFSRNDILESILNPNKVVAEKYQQDTLVTTAGKLITGTILQGGDFRSAEVRVLLHPLKPNEILTVKKSEIEIQKKSPTSMMPSGLLNTLSKAEILDLLTYLQSGGNPRHPLYGDQTGTKPK